METLLEIKNLKKTFALPGRVHLKGERVKAVNGIHLDVRQKEHLGLVGESGSGKSTLARLIVKLYQADEGEILLEGRDILKLSQRKFRPLRRNIQMVFQDPYSSLDPRYTVRKILKESLALAPERLSGKEREHKMLQALDAVDLPEDALTRFPHEFSGGERQRIAVARALMMEPRLLILDEAVSSLDVLVQAQILDLLKEIAKKTGVTYLFITHNLRVVRKLCARIAVMHQGKIVETAPTQEFFSSPSDPYTKKLITAAVDYKDSEQELG